MATATAMSIEPREPFHFFRAAAGSTAERRCKALYQAVLVVALDDLQPLSSL
jgi:hypothetical protein